MKKFIYILSILSLNFNLFSQESNPDNTEEAPSKLEQLILDIESEIDIEKRFDFSRSNSKERQLSDLKRIHNKVKSDLSRAEDLSTRLINEFDENEKVLSELEEKLTLDILKKKQIIVALGGGAFINRNIRNEVINNHISFWLKLNSDLLIKRIKNSTKRPLVLNASNTELTNCLLYTSPSPRDLSTSRMPSSA